MMLKEENFQLLIHKGTLKKERGTTQQKNPYTMENYENFKGPTRASHTQES